MPAAVVAAAKAVWAGVKKISFQQVGHQNMAMSTQQDYLSKNKR